MNKEDDAAFERWYLREGSSKTFSVLDSSDCESKRAVWHAALKSERAISALSKEDMVKVLGALQNSFPPESERYPDLETEHREAITIMQSAIGIAK